MIGPKGPDPAVTHIRSNGPALQRVDRLIDEIRSVTDESVVYFWGYTVYKLQRHWIGNEFVP